MGSATVGKNVCMIVLEDALLWAHKNECNNAACCVVATFGTKKRQPSDLIDIWSKHRPKGRCKIPARRLLEDAWKHRKSMFWLSTTLKDGHLPENQREIAIQSRWVGAISALRRARDLAKERNRRASPWILSLLGNEANLIKLSQISRSGAKAFYGVNMPNIAPVTKIKEMFRASSHPLFFESE